MDVLCEGNREDRKSNVALPRCSDSLCAGGWPAWHGFLAWALEASSSSQQHACRCDALNPPA